PGHLSRDAGKAAITGNRRVTKSSLGGTYMRRAILPTLLAIAVVGLAVLLLGRDPQAQAQRNPPVPVKWEYKVVTFSGTDKEMTKQRNDLADEGWGYTGLAAPPYYPPGGAVVGRAEVRQGGAVALRRPKP